MKIKLNLLSEARKSELRKKTHYRLIVMQGSLFIFLLLFYIIVLASVSASQSVWLKSLENTNASDEQSRIFAEINTHEKKIQNANKEASDVMRFQQEHVVWSNFFSALNSVIPDGVLLEKISTANQRISLLGVADTRDALLQFQSKLNDSKCFWNATVPLSNVFAQEKIDFQLDVDIKKECLKPGNL
jgi:Tfp pilus assembly protein PilN